MDPRAGAFEPAECAGCKRTGLQLLVCDDCETPEQGAVQDLGKQRFCAQCMIGKKVRVFWPLDEQWYVGIVQQYDETTGEHLLAYPDGDTEWVKIGDNADQQQQAQQQLQQPPPSAEQAGSGDPQRAQPQQQPPGTEQSAGQGQPPQPPAGNGSWQPPQEDQQPGASGPFRPPPPGAYGMGPPLSQYGAQYPAGQRGPPIVPPYGYPGAPPGGAIYSNRAPDVGGAGSGHQHHPVGSNKRKAGPKTWTKEEDSILLSMVKQMRMPMKWSVVAQSLPDRTGKQCRERYVNHLNPRLKSSEWTPVEDATIFRLYDTTGSQWAKMAKMIPGRTDNGIKNRFHNLRRQLEREDEHRLRLSKPEDYPGEIYLDKMRKELPKHLLGKSADLWDATAPGTLAVIAALSVLGGTGNRTHGMGGAGRFGPFRPPNAGGEQCTRCGLFAPSVQTGDEICSKTRWCKACTRVPPHLGGDLLRECLRLRKCQDEEKLKIIDDM